MALPIIPNIETTFVQINLTYVLSVIVFCLTTMATLIKIFARSQSSEEDLPGKNETCKRHEIDIAKSEKNHDDNSRKIEEANRIIGEMRVQVASLEKDNENINRNISDMKDTNKEIAVRLDDLLKQLIEWMNA